MNYGGGMGGPGGGLPPYGFGGASFPNGLAPYAANMYATGMQFGAPNMGGMQNHRAIFEQQHAAQPSGQGPLGSAPAALGPNGLYQAPELDGPDEHEGAEFIKLNPKEALKYDEYWSEASGGEGHVSGKDAVAFFSRAGKVSKSQLRHVWNIADHRNDGELDHMQFVIALRLIAIAQRGAEISVKGLRNFVGIQLIPDIKPIDPPVDDAMPLGADGSIGSSSSAITSKAPGSETLRRGGKDGDEFSWTVSPDTLSRYDQFFAGLDSKGLGHIDGRSGVTFFGKSGLPRTTLKRVWEIADQTKDGKLDLHEFRSAMHMITNLRSGRVRVEHLPHKLDPSGPFWLRTPNQVGPPDTSSRENQEFSPPPPPSSPRQMMSPSSPHRPPARAPHMHTRSPVASEPVLNVMDDDGLSHLITGSAAHAIAADGDLLAESVTGAVTSPRKSHRRASSGLSVGSDSIGGPSTPKGFGRRRESRDKLEKERAETIRTQKELEMLKAEMERLRMEQANIVKMQAHQESQEVEKLREEKHRLMAAKAQAEDDANKARLEASRLRVEAKGASHRLKKAEMATSSKSLREKASDQGTFIDVEEGRDRDTFLSSKLQSHREPSTAAGSPSFVGTFGTNMSSLNSTSLGRGQEDDADFAGQLAASEPEPVTATASAPTRGTANTAKPKSKLLDDDSLSDSDEDDFWGTGGVGSKPALGSATESIEVSNTQAASAGFGNDLDEWAF